MALILGFPTQDGIRRLLTQPGDVVARDGRISRRKAAGASPRHRRLYPDYKVDLRTAYEIAEPWWAATVAAQRDMGLDGLDAVRSAYVTRLAGPASHPNVVWIVRNYWLDCVDASAECSPDETVYPETFLLQWLIDDNEKELVALIACMPYWPIGLDEHGNWC